MSTINISLPDDLKHFVDRQATERGYGTRGEYVRELIGHDQARQILRGLLLKGALSAPGVPVNDDYFAALRDRAQGR
ncbi:type II toxin-antitoxin system ParD family antitoxin [Mesorhizobium sp. B2-9-1]|uniref:ribbon-helix-helix domain-containing protein n=1 Tax=Mesorhizobium sp. B2-9-1 TaxID=2589898 RepID=UPI0011285CC0|nr:type II toxin-antitoxin system ParD family antitoxin [Mesorhizobium sp. B2-9-1]TPI48984.1 type II toxin-antitoxin system ParD family antitoxin [Mesorhizobium sp. B2-9-1]